MADRFRRTESEGFVESLDKLLPTRQFLCSLKGFHVLGDLSATTGACLRKSQARSGGWKNFFNFFFFWKTNRPNEKIGDFGRLVFPKKKLKKF